MTKPVRPDLASLVLEYFRLRAVGAGRDKAGADRIAHLETSMVYQARRDAAVNPSAIRIAADAIGRWIEIRVPGNSPELKGPFSLAMLQDTLVELVSERRNAYFTVITVDAEGPLLQDGGEWLEVTAPQYAELVKGYRAERSGRSDNDNGAALPRP